MRKICILIYSLTFLLMVFLGQEKVRANGDLVNLHIMTEVQKVGDTAWKNYSGTEGARNETLSANPGDQIKVRVKLWDDGTQDAAVTGAGTLTNSSYIASIDAVNENDDGDAISYVGNFFAGAGTATLSGFEQPGTVDAHYESMTATFTLSGSFPEGETIILGNASITSYTPGRSIGIGRAKTPKKSWLARIFGLSVAQAEGTGRESGFRISVNREVATTTTSALPKTGSGEQNNFPWQLAVSMTIIGLLYIGYYLSRRVNAGSKK